MQYKSTRNAALRVTAAQAIAQGISDEGGLFVPETFPAADLNAMLPLDYVGRAEYVLARFLTDFTAEEIAECAARAYSPEKFENGSPAKVVSLDAHGENKHVLELWHGPTCAFKDMALQILPHLLTKSLSKTADGKTAVILVATSGDTGKAALEGFRDVAGTEMIVFYPENGVSPMQKRQMDTQEGENLCVCAIEGNFDDAQTGVKRIFTNAAVKATLAARNKMFSSANSICPWWASTICFTMRSPMTWGADGICFCGEGWYRAFMTARGIPCPLSEKVSSAIPAACLAVSSIRQPSGLWRMLLPVRLRKARRRRSASPPTIQPSISGEMESSRSKESGRPLFICQAASSRSRAAGEQGAVRRG